MKFFSQHDFFLMSEAVVPVFRLCPYAQWVIVRLQQIMLDVPYFAFGFTQGSSIRGYNVVFPSTFGSARRKPVSRRFQMFSETYFWPIIRVLLFGNAMQDKLKTYMSSHKINTLVISGDEDHYGKGIYHMHLDHSIGRRNMRDMMQRQMFRILFSTVPSAVSQNDSFFVQHDCPEHDSTVYLKMQPTDGIRSVSDMHSWLQERYEECGISRNKLRPLYAVPTDDIVRAKPGEVFVHASHGYGHVGAGYPIHAEANPCPLGRCYNAIDLTDVIHLLRRPNGNVRGALPPNRVPLADVMHHMGVTSRPDAFVTRMDEAIVMLRATIVEAQEHEQILLLLSLAVLWDCHKQYG